MRCQTTSQCQLQSAPAGCFCSRAVLDAAQLVKMGVMQVLEREQDMKTPASNPMVIKAAPMDQGSRECVEIGGNPKT